MSPGMILSPGMTLLRMVQANKPGRAFEDVIVEKFTEVIKKVVCNKEHMRAGHYSVMQTLYCVEYCNPKHMIFMGLKGRMHP